MTYKVYRDSFLIFILISCLCFIATWGFSRYVKLEHDRIFQSLRVLIDCFLLMELQGVLGLTIAQLKRPGRLVGPVS